MLALASIRSCGISTGPTSLYTAASSCPRQTQRPAGSEARKAAAARRARAEGNERAAEDAGGVTRCGDRVARKGVGSAPRAS